MSIYHKERSKKMNNFKIISIVLFLLSAFFINEATAQTQVSSKAVSWKYTTSGGINASPVIYDGILYIGSFDSCFYAIDAKTGNREVAL